MSHPTIKPEIMSPAGYWPQLHAAIEAGADAVYFGLTHFSARAKVGFTLDELPEVMRPCTAGASGAMSPSTPSSLTTNWTKPPRTLARDRRGRGRRRHRAGCGHRPAGPPDRAGDGSPRQHADEHHQRRGDCPGPALWRQPGGAGPGTVPGRHSHHPRPDRLRIGDVCPRRALRLLLGPVLLVRGLGRTQRQPRPVRPGLPPALRTDRG